MVVIIKTLTIPFILLNMYAKFVYYTEIINDKQFNVNWLKKTDHIEIKKNNEVDIELYKKKNFIAV